MSKKEPVFFSGTLRGGGYGATCTVCALKVTEPDSGSSTFSRHTIMDVSGPLPDGEYELAFDGLTKQVVLRDGLWEF